MNINSIPKVIGSKKRRKRVGRGIGSGLGKTSTRGQKGQKARTGSSKRPGFEGGQNPLIRRLPKRGFIRKATGQAPEILIVNIKDLNRFKPGTDVTPHELQKAGLINNSKKARVKVLGDGELKASLNIRVHQVSASAETKIKAAKGNIELIANNHSKQEEAK